MIQHGCPNCGGALFTERYKAENRWFTEVSCINCARIWTPRNMHEIVEAYKERGQLAKAKLMEKLLNKAVTMEGVQRYIV